MTYANTYLVRSQVESYWFVFTLYSYRNIIKSYLCAHQIIPLNKVCFIVQSSAKTFFYSFVIIWYIEDIY